MTTAVTKESLAARIAELESGARSLKEDYTLAAYKMLLATMDGYVIVPKEMTDEIGEAIAMRARCCGGIALDIYDAILAAAQKPATVMPEEMPCGGAADDYHDGYQDGWNACRAAMLNQK